MKEGVFISKHGGNIGKLKRDFAIGGRLIDFSANINPLGMPKIFKESIAANIDLVESYPDFEYHELKKALAGYYNIEDAQITVANGAEEIIRNYFLCKKPSVIIIDPTFSEYRESASISGAKTMSYQVGEEDGFYMDLDKFLAWLDSNDIRNWSIFFCNPNNPTSLAYSQIYIQDLARELGHRACKLVLDESFIGFTGEDSFISQIHDYENVLIIQSLTKFYAIPGLRLGFACSSNRDLIGDLEGFRADWSVNSFADLCGQKISQLNTYRKESRAYIKEEKERIIYEISKLEKIRIIGSAANFLMVHTSIDNFYQKMLNKSIVLRSCHNFKGLDESYFRIAIRTRDENDKLLHAIRKIHKDEYIL